MLCNILMATSNNPIEIVSLSFIAHWKFNTSEEMCQICKEHFESPCLSCSEKQTEIICDVSRGKCGHCYHKHCIDQWLTKSPICPTCLTPYATDLKNINNIMGKYICRTKDEVIKK